MTQQKKHPYIKKQLFVIFLSLLQSSLWAAVPFLINNIITRIENGNAITVKLIVATISVVITGNIMNYISNYFFNVLPYLVAHDKRNEIFKRVLYSPVKNKQNFDDSQLINRLMNEVYCYGTIIGTAPMMLTVNIIMFTISAVVLCKINFYIFIFCAAFIPVIFGTANLMKKIVENTALINRKKYEELFSVLEEILKAYNGIKIFLAEKSILSKFLPLNKAYFLSEKRNQKINRLYTDTINILYSLLPIAGLLFGLFLTPLGKSSTGSAVAFYMYLSFFIEPITNLTNLRLGIMQSKKKETMMQEVISTFENASKTTDIDDQKLIGDDMLPIEIKNIFYDYDSCIVEFAPKINIIKSGVYYIGGKSGTGKSTMLKLLAKIITSDKNHITIAGGRNINEIPEAEYLQYVTYINGEPMFFSGTIAENINYYYTEREIESTTFSSFFDTDENITPETVLNTSEGITLSTGQLQRINILRVIAKGKSQRLIILDEALSGVDENREKTIIKFLKNYFSSAVILLVTHRTSTKNVCDGVYSLHE